MPLVTLTNTFDFNGIQYLWNPNDDYSWMSDSLGGKYNFYYRVEDMVTDRILDNTRKKILEHIMTQLRTWYIKHIHDKVTDAGINNSTIAGWKEIMENVDL